MTDIKTSISLTALVFTCSLTTFSLLALPVQVSANDTNSYGDSTQSKRIEVYSLSQNYWDTRPGDTLGEIVLHLLPNNPSKHDALQQDIVQLNPRAFVDGDASRLLAGERLWLPGYMKQADSTADPDTTRVETYSWGNIKRSK